MVSQEPLASINVDGRFLEILRGQAIRQVGNALDLALQGRLPRQPGAQWDMQPLDLVITETLTGGIIQHTGQRVEQEHSRGIHMQFSNRLLQQDVEGDMDIHAGADGDVNLVQGRQVVQAFLGLGKQAGILDIRCGSIGNQG